ncbi:hypothetical protein LLH03_10580 [bacterium]|nr:hypothetical protein [bacterium]
MRRLAILLSAVLVVALCVVAAHYMIVTARAPEGTEAIAAPPVSQPGTDAPAGTQQTTQTGPTADVTPEATREIAARLLSCEPAALKLARTQPKPKSYAWGRLEEVAWTGHCALGNFPAADLEIQVDRVGAYVRSIRWEYPAAPTASSADGERITADEAASLALQFFTKRAGLPVGNKPPRVRRQGSEANPYLVCDVSGSYPDGRRFLASMGRWARSPRPVRYDCVIFPPDPPATSAVRLTEADAVKAAEAAVRTMGNLIPVRSEVVRLTTASNYAARGVPVYEVDLRMEVVTPGRDDRRAVCRDLWGVNATTGEVVTTADLEKRRTTGTTPAPEK